MEDRDAEEFVLVLQGYYRLLTNQELYVDLEKDFWTEDSAPTYHSRHTVFCAPWNYAPNSDAENEKYVDFASTPQFTLPNETSNSNVSFPFYTQYHKLLFEVVCVFTIIPNLSSKDIECLIKRGWIP